MKLPQKIFFSLCAFLIFFAALEIIQRMRHPHVGFRGMDNSLGYHDLEFQRQKAPGVIRVVFIGSSTTYGGDSIRKNFPALAGRLLSKKRPDLKIETINAAQPSKTSYWEIVRMKETLALSPDFFVVMTGYNDSATIYQDFVKIQENGELFLMPWYFRLHRWIARHSIFYVTLREKIALMRYGKAFYAFDSPADPEKEKNLEKGEWFDHYPEHFRRNLKQMIALARENHIKIVFIKAPLSPQRRQEHPLYAKAYIRLIDELLQSSGGQVVPIIDLEPAFTGGRWRRYIGYDGLHFTDAGNVKIARVISRYFDKALAPVSGS